MSLIAAHLFFHSQARLGLVGDLAMRLGYPCTQCLAPGDFWFFLYAFYTLVQEGVDNAPVLCNT